MIRLALRVPAEQAELVLAELLELSPAGVEEVQGEPGSAAAGTVEYAVYGAPGELPSLPDLRAAAGATLVEVSTSEVADDWGERWRRFHRPVLIEAPAPCGEGGARVPSLRVRPPWEPAAEVAKGSSVQEIVIDPGQAFGTGAHASTRLCLELLLELAAREPHRGPVLDVGTGSGVLAIAAGRLGFGPVLALDNERESVIAALENARVNGAALEVCQLDLRAQPLPWPARASTCCAAGAPPAPAVVIANLLRPLLLELSERLPAAPRHLLAGGLLAVEADELAGAFAARLGMHERERRARGEWAALWLTREG